jgi:hypothetical protein
MSSRSNAGLAVLALICGFSACSDREPSAPPAPGTYWPDNACTFARWRWCVESVTVREDGQLTFRCLWELDSSSLGGITKGPDEGNRNMYVVDGRARRHDHVATTEFARLGGELTRKTPARRGDFVFQVSRNVDPPFTFRDDDQKVAIAGIQLEPARMSIADRPPAPGSEDVTALLGRIRNADRVEILNTGAGLLGSSATRVLLRRESSPSTEGAAIPTPVLDGFLGMLAEAPLVDGPYHPHFDHTDDFPRFSIIIGAGDDPIVFFSESQGTDRVPWAVRIGGTIYVIPSDAPARALDLVRGYYSKS